MKRYVVDASVILKWILGDEREADQGKARELLNAWAQGEADLFAPTLWQYEVGNFLGRELPGHADKNMKILLGMGIRGQDLNENMCSRCFLWMKEKGVSFYDASYLAVAGDLKATLVTADERFVKKMENHDRICLLKDLTLI
jgi:predicted nucleic acid-binding protein